MTSTPVLLNSVCIEPALSVNTAYQRHNRVFTNDGIARRITVLTPSNDRGSDCRPVIFATDANLLLPAVTSDVLTRLARRRNAPVLVLMGYDTENTETIFRRRAFDYTPEFGSAVDDLSPERRNGGADAFIDFIEDTLKPYVQTLTRADKREMILYGHSYGALLTLYLLSRRPSAFSRFVAADPSLWWKNGHLIQVLQNFCQSVVLKSPTALWLMQSGRHHRHRAPLTESQRQIMHSVSAAQQQALFDALSAKPGLTMHRTRFPDHTHGDLLTDGFLLSLGLDPLYVSSRC